MILSHRHDRSRTARGFNFFLGLLFGLLLSLVSRHISPITEDADFLRSVGTRLPKRTMATSNINTSYYSESFDPWIDGCERSENLPTRKWVHPLRFWEEQRMASNGEICPTLAFNMKLASDSYTILGKTAGVYYHLHKVGGSTIRKAHFNQEVARLEDGHIEDFTPRAENLLQRVANTPDAILFTFMRDPVTRFLSGLGQILRMPRKKNLRPCPSTANNFQQLMECVLDQIEGNLSHNSSTPAQPSDSGSSIDLNFLDLHLLPQTIELLSAVKGSYLPVMIMPLDQLGQFLKLCASSDPNKHIRSQSHNKTAGKFLVDESALTPSIVRRICNAYHWDIKFLKQQLDGDIPTLCDNFGVP